MSIEQYIQTVKAMDNSISRVLAKQVEDPNRFDYGGIEKPHLGLADSEYGINDLLSVYFCPESRFYLNKELRERLIRTLEYLVRTQHEDGTIDLYETNFYSPPDTSFRVWLYAPWVEYLRKIGIEKDILFLLEHFLKRAIPALKSGGFHTPNHRWVQASALARLGTLFNDKECKLIAQEYLEEGIDCNRDGLFYERSLGVYNPICGIAMLWLAEDLEKPELIDYTEKVLNLATHFLELDGTLLNTFSLRQDRGIRMPADVRYYYLFKKMGILRENGTYLYASDVIFNGNINRLGKGFNPLHLFLFYPEFKDEVIERKPLPRYGIFHFEDSGIVRINSGKNSLTFTRDSDEFLTIVIDDIDIRFRYLTSFFGKGPFIGSSLEKEESGYSLKQKLIWGYVDLLPREERGKEIQWDKMNHSLRRWIKSQEISTDITLIPEDLQKAKLCIKTEGCKGVLTTLEISLPKNGEITFDGRVTRLKEDTYLLEDGKVLYQKENSFFELSPGFKSHKLVEYRGDRSIKSKDKIYIAITFQVPFEHTLNLSYGEIFKFS
ncbi:hypothetical protein H5T89_11985 [bacterium]|nr:hypothetical protein [bacterium]